MLLAGSDISGSQKGNQQKYISFVICTEEAINQVHNKIGYHYIHMRRFKPKKRDKVIKKTNFHNKDIMAICLEIDRQKTTNYFLGHKRLRKGITKENIHKTFDNVLFSLFRNMINEFIQKYDGISSLIGLNVQHDPDTTFALNRWKMIPVEKGKAYQLADVVAWCNERKSPLNGCDDYIFSENIVNTMKRRLLK